VEVWRGDAAVNYSVSYPSNTLRPRVPHLPAGDLRLVFLTRGQGSDWQVLGPTVAQRESTVRSDELLARYHAAVQSWKELDAIEPDARPLAEYRWLIEQFRQPEFRKSVVRELAGSSVQQAWRPGHFAAQAALEPASFWLSAWPEVSAFHADGRDLLALLRQSDADAAAAWLLGQLDANWRTAERKDWSQLLANLTALAGDARYPEADRGEAAFLSFLDRWLEADAAGVDKAELKPAYLQLRVELLAWLTQAEAVHRLPW
jgi:hypothetical protein